MTHNRKSMVGRFGLILFFIILVGFFGNLAMAECKNDYQFTTEFQLGNCEFDASDDYGQNPYFILTPGHTSELVGEEDGEIIRLKIEVLGETKNIVLGDTSLVARVVIESEWVDDVLVEVSENWYARCMQTNAVYYFGEEVDNYIYEDDKVVINHDGSWEAGEEGALPGLIMPGTFLLGAKYFQELALEAEAMDRGENTAIGLTFGAYEDCVEIVDTNPVEGVCKKKHGDVKIYCPGIGLVQDESVMLIPTP